MTGNPIRTVRMTRRLTPEEAARDRAIRREVYAEFPSVRMIRYRDLAGKLAHVREINGGHGSADEDALLEEMDLIWRKLTAEERDVIGQEPSKSLKRTSE